MRDIDNNENNNKVTAVINNILQYHSLAIFKYKTALGNNLPKGGGGSKRFIFLLSILALLLTFAASNFFRCSFRCCLDIMEQTIGYSERKRKREKEKKAVDWDGNIKK